MTKILVIAPHPDDETLGCGGTLLRHRADGDEIHWLIVTTMKAEDSWPAARIKAREDEILKVTAHYSFASRHELGFPAARLESIPLGDLVRAFASAFESVRPEMLYIPYHGDAHSDHRVSAEAGIAASKWFRCPSLQRILTYETLSETGFNPLAPALRPNSYVDIAPYVDGKIAAMNLYAGETGEFPFPRSEHAIRAQAALHGTACGKAAAEAFVIVRDVR